MKTLLIILSIFTSITAFGQNNDIQTKTGKSLLKIQDDYNLVMLGASWNWTPQIHRPEFITEKEHDIALEIIYIKKLRKNIANRFGVGYTFGDNYKLGETFNQEDTILRAVYLPYF